MQTSNKKAIVIGASSGIGREIALRLIRDGWTVGVAARRTDLLETLRQEAPERVFTTRIDVTGPEAPTALNELIAKTGGMDLYFHASGIGKQNKALCDDIELRTAETNGVGFMRMVGAAFRYMAAHGGGHIAAISSVAGVRGLGPAPAYSATKALMSSYIEALEQLSCSNHLGVTFTDIRPGFIDTDLIKGDHFPMTMSLPYASRRIYRAVLHHRHVAYIDWRWHVLVILERLVPRYLWRRMRLG